MNYEFRFQDPTSASTVYLFEAILAEVQSSIKWRGVFAFASQGGVETLFEDPVVVDFLKSGELDLLLGVDAITNRPTLERLKGLASQYPKFNVRVFWNRTTGLFHPKISFFQRRDGSKSLIVGSGNLTPGGLRENFEAYSILTASEKESLSIESWDDFIVRHRSDIREIDEEVLARAARNVIRGGRRRRTEVEPDVPVDPEAAEDVGGKRVLVAQVPAASGRWHQVHFNKEAIDQFFRVHPNSLERAYLRERMADGSLGKEEARPCVYSESNKNHKIEVGAKAGADYPTSGGPPVAVFRELQARTFEYMLLMPGEAGHRRMLALTGKLPAIGRGLKRVITDVGRLKEEWPNCPLLKPAATSAET